MNLEERSTEKSGGPPFFPDVILPPFSSECSEKNSSGAADTPHSLSPTTAPPEPPQPPLQQQQSAINTEMLVMIIHRLMEEQHQRYAQQQSAVVKLYRELQGSVSQLREEVHQIMLSVQSLRATQHLPSNHSLLTTMTSGSGLQDPDRIGGSTPESLIHPTENSSSLSGYALSKSLLGSDAYYRIHSIPIPKRSQTRPMSAHGGGGGRIAGGNQTKEEEGEEGEEMMMIEEEETRRKEKKVPSGAALGMRREEGLQENKGKEMNKEGVEQLAPLDGLSVTTPQRGAQGGGVAAGSIRPSMPSPIPFSREGERHGGSPVEGSGGVEEDEGDGGGILAPPYPPSRRRSDVAMRGREGEGERSSKLLEALLEEGKGVPKEEEEAAKTTTDSSTAVVNEQARQRKKKEKEEEEEMGRAILEEMSRDADPSAHYNHARHLYLPHARLPSPLQSVLQQQQQQRQQVAHFRSLEDPSATSGMGYHGIAAGGSSSSDFSSSNSGGGAKASLPLPPGVSATVAGGLHTASLCPTQRIQEATARYEEILERIATSPIASGLIPALGMSSPSSSLSAAAGGGSVGDSVGLSPSLWLDPSLGTAGVGGFGAGAGAGSAGGGGGGGFSQLSVGSAGGNIAMLGGGGATRHTPTPTGRSTMAATPNSLIGTAHHTALHTANTLHPVSSSMSHSGTSNFMVNGMTNSFISLDPAAVNAPQNNLEMQQMMGSRSLMVKNSNLSDHSFSHSSYHSGMGGGQVIGVNSSSSSSSGGGVNHNNNNNNGGGGSAVSTDVSAVLAEDPTSAEVLQSLRELPCTTTVSASYHDGRPRVTRLTKTTATLLLNTTAVHTANVPPTTNPGDDSNHNHPPPHNSNSAGQQNPMSESGTSQLTNNSSIPWQGGSPIAARAASTGGTGTAAGGTKENSDSLASTSTAVVAAQSSRGFPVVSASSSSSHHFSSASLSTAPTTTIIADDPEIYGLNRHQPYHVLVEFKRHRTVQYESDEYIHPGQYVVVGADRGKDLGLVICTWCEDALPSPHGVPNTIPNSPDSSSGVAAAASAAGGGAENNLNSAFCLSPNNLSAWGGLGSGSTEISGAGVAGASSSTSVNSSHGGGTGRAGGSTTGSPFMHSFAIKGLRLAGAVLPSTLRVCRGVVLRFADESEVSQLHFVQAELEHRALEVCQQRVLESKVPMVLVDAEYQYDSKKLTIFYVAQQRTDFRELVRNLYKSFRARIWMEMVEDETV